MRFAAGQFLERLRRAEDGVAMIEFAFSLIFFALPLFLGGVELTNYALTRMRVSQVALHVADNASRIGIDSLLAKPRITETQLNDLLIGANLQGGDLNLQTNGRVILSSVEPIADPNPTDKYKIRWQRCYGGATWPSSYGAAGATNLAGVGPANKQVKAPPSGGVMFVEVGYKYQPIFPITGIVKATTIRETAAMVVRDDRDFAGNNGTGTYNTEGATVSSC